MDCIIRNYVLIIPVEFQDRYDTFRWFEYVSSLRIQTNGGYSLGKEQITAQLVHGMA